MNCDSVKARSWAGQIGKRQPAAAAASQRGGVGLALAGVGLVVSLSVSLVSPSRRHGDTAAALPLCLSPSRTLAQSLVALASRSLTFLSSFFFFFFFFFLWFLLSPFGFGLLRAEIFSFFFFVVVD